MTVSLIAALTQNRVIGKNNDLPWSLPDDMKFFMETTKGHHVIMGRKNYDSIPLKFRPLPHRTNVVVTRQQNFTAPGCIVLNSIQKGIELAKANNEPEVFIIGGAEIYKQAIEKANRLYLTEIKTELHGDTYFPDFDKKQWQELSRKAHAADSKHLYAFDFVIYERQN